ncbi:hypothetical protein MOD31_12375 [Paenarthrobacter sp. TYUT067]|uniref:hypothetical protein n=1 Tax=Paenarthrobacter sp. TYUT067 TaxID=2926245 RepID=UPI00202F75F9|nr:hypothetical protein [Paenarthrobacter sp. TYUT067]MCM0616824.1 hypothetical protein [Paenarthrobacter sp. TYUT067]
MSLDTPSPVSGPSWTVTMFSLTNELLAGKRSATDLIHDVLDLGITTHIEVDGFQGFSSFPAVNSEEICRFRMAMDHRSAHPTILGVYTDPATRRGGVFAVDEVAEFLAVQIRAASALGFETARIAFGVPAKVLELMVPLLESREIQLVQEVQASVGPDSPQLHSQLDTLDRLGSHCLGLLLDTSTSMPALPVSYLRQLRSGGVEDWLVDALEIQWTEHGAEPLRSEIHRQLPKLSPQAANLLMMPLLRFGHTPIHHWDALLPRFAAFHFKYWDLEDSDQRVSAPILHLLNCLKLNGFSGPVVSEWGGHEWCELEDMTGVEMVQRHHQLCMAPADATRR